MTKSRDLANAATALNAVTATELGFVDGVTSAIQTQLDAKLATATAATTYVANSLADAKGDLLTATADNTPARLAVGNNGETLVADSSTSTGLRYQGNYTAGKNAIINGGMDIWQRGTSFTTNGYSADRWYRNSNGANRTYSRQTTSDTTNLPFIQYCMRVARNSGNTTTDSLEFVTSLETANSLPYAGKTVTLSFYARAGANFSAASNRLGVYLISGTGTDQGWISPGYTGTAYPINNQTATLTTTWQRFTFTGTVATTATELSSFFFYEPLGTAGAADYYEITGVQLELGSVATAFTRAGGTIQGELAACQRYYQKSYNIDVAPQTNTTGVGLVALISSANSVVATSARVGYVFLKTTMRTTPTVTIYSYTSSTAGVVSNGAGTDLAANSGLVEYQGSNGFVIYNFSGGNITPSNGTFVAHYVASAEL